MESQTNNGLNTNLQFADKTMGLTSSDSTPKQDSDRAKNDKIKSYVLHLKTQTGNMKLDDHDETSSGYSSPESHYWTVEERIPYHRPQASNVTSMSNIETTKNCLMDTAVEKNSSNSVTIKQNKDDNIQNTALPKSKSPPPTKRRTFSRQARVDSNSELKQKNSNKCNEIEKELINNLIEKQVQTEPYELQSDVIQSLQKSNSELRKRLEDKNECLEKVVDELENQLLTAMTEIAQLRSQLLAVNKQKMQTSCCPKCGYSSEGEVNHSEKTSNSRPKSPQNIRKSSSVGCLSQKSNSSSNMPSVKVILKGKDPNEMKLALLQRNKTLRDEIENLKFVKVASRMSSASSMISAKLPSSASTSRSSATDYDKYDLAMDQFITKETEVLSRRKTNQRSVHEHVRWKQTPRSSKKSTKNNQIQPQSTSRAFRTIDVKRWAATTT